MSTDRVPATDVPLVSIGVPVFNEADHLAGAIDSLLDQDYGHIELVMSDNGSTDGTEAICRDYADRDARIKYERTPDNRGAAANSNRIIEMASGPYFMRASGHDRWSSNYVSECVAELEARPAAVVCFGSTEWVDEAGRAYPRETGWTDTRGMSTIERFFAQLWGNMHPIMGVARTAAVRKAMPFSDMAAADLAFLLELSLMGDFIHAPVATWYRRETRGAQSYASRMQRYRSADVGLVTSRFSALAPYAKLLGRVPRLIVRADISLVDKVILIALLYPTAIGRYVAARKRHDAVYQRETAGS